MLQIYKYDSSYAKLFQSEREKINKLLGDNCLIEHIGSTAVPNLDGKGVIDILLIFNSVDEIKSSVELLTNGGYYLSADKKSRKGRIFMTSTGKKESSPGDVHLHLLTKDNIECQQLILFRDYLIRHQDAKLAYSDLKYELFSKVGGNRKEYTRLKDDYIKKIIGLVQNKKS